MQPITDDVFHCNNSEAVNSAFLGMVKCDFGVVRVGRCVLEEPQNLVGQTRAEQANEIRLVKRSRNRNRNSRRRGVKKCMFYLSLIPKLLQVKKNFRMEYCQQRNPVGGISFFIISRCSLLLVSCITRSLKTPPDQVLNFTFSSFFFFFLPSARRLGLTKLERNY